ncbi:IS3 family transposase [Bacillus paranthracis]|nr:IS3 family transposase [Bacillus paranthracis]
MHNVLQTFTPAKYPILEQQNPYYNHYRYQWNLKKMTPVEYRNHLLDVA